MNKIVYGVYASGEDMTFIIEDTWENDKLISTEVKGFYFGKPNETGTKTFYGNLKAVME